jgi:2'-5' RNA ligase
VNLRLFVALDPPEPLRRELAVRQAALRLGAGRHADVVRWTPADRLHVTLRFLGPVPEERVGAVRAAMAGAAARSRPLRLEVLGAGGYPTSRRPRVIWLGLRGDTGGLAALVADLGNGLEAMGLPPEGRPLTPHFTVGRCRGGRGAAGLGGALAGAASEPALSWQATEISLFRSHLGRDGARYEVLARAHLGPAGGEAGDEAGVK